MKVPHHREERPAAWRGVRAGAGSRPGTASGKRRCCADRAESRPRSPARVVAREGFGSSAWMIRAVTSSRMAVWDGIWFPPMPFCLYSPTGLVEPEAALSETLWHCVGRLYIEEVSTGARGGRILSQTRPDPASSLRSRRETHPPAAPSSSQASGSRSRFCGRPTSSRMRAASSGEDRKSLRKLPHERPRNRTGMAGRLLPGGRLQMPMQPSGCWTSCSPSPGSTAPASPSTGC